MCNISCVQQIFESAELGKNTEIVAGFIVQVLWLAESARPMEPQKYFRSGTVIRHPPEIFIGMHKFLNWRK